MIFPVVMYGCESWTVRKAESRRTYAFKLWCWRRFLRVPCTARKSNQKEMAIHSRTIAWKIPGTEEPGRLQSMGSQRVGHDWTTSLHFTSILKEINPEYSLKGLMLKLKPKYFGYLIQRTDSLEKTWCWERLKAKGEQGGRGWDSKVASPTWWTWIWVNSGR